MALLDPLASILRQLGEELMVWRRSALGRGEWQGTQFKSEADGKAHRALCNLLHRATPDVPIISEEAPESHAGQRPGRYWLIDPIDGTASYAEGYSGFVTQAALMVEGTPIQAAIFAPALDLLYMAEKGKGAALNGKPLDLSRTGHGGKVLIDNYPEPRGLAREIFSDLRFTTYLESGSIGLKICRVADGSADLFFKDVVVRDWDIAPGHLVLEEAGGILGDKYAAKMIYEGGFEKNGVIASRSKEIANELDHWLKHKKSYKDC